MAGLSVNLIALQLFAGLALGAIYVLFAIGLSLIFGMLTVVNFAHGAFYMVGAYVGVYMLMLGGDFWICLVMVPLAVGLFGLAVERILIRPLYGRGIDYPLLLTFGLSYVMVELVRIAFGKTGFPFDTPEVLQGAVNIGVGYFPLYRLFVIGATAAVLLALWLFLEKTSFGLIIRAGARDPQIVRVLGVNVARVWLIVFGCRFSGAIGCAPSGRKPGDGQHHSCRGVCGDGGRRHGIDRGRGARRLAGRRRRQHDLAVCAGDGKSIDFCADGDCSDRSPPRFLRPRRIDELKGSTSS